MPLTKIPSSKASSSMTDVEADQPTKFSLMMKGNMSILRPYHIDEDISNMSEIIIGHDKDLQK